MANIRKAKQTINVRSHMEEQIFGLLDKYLPENYAVEAERRLKIAGVDVSKNIIRNVRNERGGSPFKNQVLKVLVDMAKEEQDAIDSIEEAMNL